MLFFFATLFTLIAFIYPIYINSCAALILVLIIGYYSFIVILGYIFHNALIDSAIFNWMKYIHIPIVLAIMAFFFVDNKLLFIVLLYLIIVISYLIPLLKYVYLRIRFFVAIKNKDSNSQIKFWKILLCGTKKIYYFDLDVSDNHYVIGVLGSVSVMRYIFDANKLTCQRINPLLKDNIIDLDYNDSQILNIPKKLLSGKKRSYEEKREEKTYLFVHPNSIVEHNKQLVEYGSTAENFRVVDIRSSLSWIR